MDRTFQHQVYDKTQRDMEVKLATESCKCDNPNQNRIFGNAGGQGRRSAKMGEESVRDTAGGVLADVEWTRRGFIGRLGGMMAAAGVRVPFAGPAMAAAAADRTADCRPRYRAVSWWLSFDDLAWPNGELMDAVRRRADRCAAGGVNCCIIFGAHFRWDFLPLWGRLHDLLRTIAGELHQRHILLFDHHSSVATHRPRTPEEARNIWRRNRHHVPFYPSEEAAATWEFNGSRLNDWRMIDVETGRPVYLPDYNAEQYCMNHPAFREAYGRYVRKLVTETDIDGLMSDDGIYYADWRACGCHALPGAFPSGVWAGAAAGGRCRFLGQSPERGVSRLDRDTFSQQRRLPRGRARGVAGGFPLLTCCSSSDGHALPAYGMSYQDFIRNCNHVMLEMVGSTPTVAGTWDDRIPSQMLHLGIARDHRAPCFGLGYGYFPDTAFFIWALNKFLGSDCWFSTLKGRLGATSAQLAALADDPGTRGGGIPVGASPSAAFHGRGRHRHRGALFPGDARLLRPGAGRLRERLPRQLPAPDAGGNLVRRRHRDPIGGPDTAIRAQQRRVPVGGGTARAGRIHGGRRHRDRDRALRILRPAGQSCGAGRGCASSAWRRSGSTRRGQGAFRPTDTTGNRSRWRRAACRRRPDRQ